MGHAVIIKYSYKGSFGIMACAYERELLRKLSKKLHLLPLANVYLLPLIIIFENAEIFQTQEFIQSI
jgi:hypothetical protein